MARDFNRPDYFTMLRSMSSTELDDWYQFHQERPLQQDALQWQLAHIAAGTHGVNGGKADNYLPKISKPKSIKDQIAIWKSMV
ncbi:phage tail assembly protein T [Microbulbifer sp. SAOS-129_SWC]|uniref:phage tail assembly protein T n=1 Tax=Microbulbifer sp. SAOS-129_SWC TaxID=3145235 RepID=UPI0032176E04